LNRFSYGAALWSVKLEFPFMYDIYPFPFSRIPVLPVSIQELCILSHTQITDSSLLHFIKGMEIKRA
jgi:hypothetical protein